MAWAWIQSSQALDTWLNVSYKFATARSNIRKPKSLSLKPTIEYGQTPQPKILLLSSVAFFLTYTCDNRMQVGIQDTSVLHHALFSEPMCLPPVSSQLRLLEVLIFELAGVPKPTQNMF